MQMQMGNRIACISDKKLVTVTEDETEIGAPTSVCILMTQKMSTVMSGNTFPIVQLAVCFIIRISGVKLWTDPKVICKYFPNAGL